MDVNEWNNNDVLSAFYHTRKFLTGSLIHIRQKDQENRTRNRIEIASGPL
jgi:hypothetical protein